MVEIGHELRLPKVLPLHHQRLDEKLGLVQKIVEGRRAQVDFPTRAGGKTRLMQEEPLPVILQLARLEIESEEPEDPVAFPGVSRRIARFQTFGRRHWLGESVGIHSLPPRSRRARPDQRGAGAPMKLCELDH